MVGGSDGGSEDEEDLVKGWWVNFLTFFIN